VAPKAVGPQGRVPEGSVRVLIVDNEPELTVPLSMASVASVFVSGAGRRPFLAADGHSAPRIARGCSPNAPVLDGMLPDADGLQALRADCGRGTPERR
jgi:two-component system OmpR family response regulator